MADYDGSGGLDRFFAEIKKVAGVAPVDELFSSFTYYLTTFKQGPHDSIREYVEGEAETWEQVQEAVAQMDGSDNIDDQELKKVLVQ